MSSSPKTMSLRIGVFPVLRPSKGAREPCQVDGSYEIISIVISMVTICTPTAEKTVQDGGCHLEP